jgi:RHS repeat-associated protein
MKTKPTLALAAILTSCAFAEMPAKLPEFMNPEQLAKWRAETAAENAAKAKSNPSKPDARSSNPDVPTPFFTGKPYIESTGTYAFKYRSYNPVLARWTSEDPSGFPDGSNNHKYGNSPTNGLDATGLVWEFVGSNHLAGGYSDTYTAPVLLEGTYYGSVFISGFSNGRAESLTAIITVGTTIEGLISGAYAEISKTFSLGISPTSGEVTISGVTQFTKPDHAFGVGYVESAYNAGIQDGQNVVQGKVAFGHGYSDAGSVNIGYEGSGLNVGVSFDEFDWNFPSAISFSVNKHHFE